MIEKIAGLSIEAATAKKPDDPAKVRDAAQQFEALLLSQLLKNVRESASGGWLGGGEDQAGESAMGMAEEQFARALSLSGGLGLTSMVVSGLERPKTTPSVRGSEPPV